ncbi:transposase [Microvirga arabica]|uniref:transposase n=1 Tax=Microvirga arabica TaxID=1128671 RepID=UPI0019395BCB|nr:transposase [Microvirga arabica]MBM1175473.1 transposase [Microvirga arabica]
MTYCRLCQLKPQCTWDGRRLITLRLREEHEILEAACEHEAQPAFSREYSQRTGIAGTVLAGVGVLHLRRSRYLGPAKTHLQHVPAAAAINLIRIAI